VKRRIAILGSTGSIGTQALDLIERHSDRFSVVGLAAGRRSAELADQVRRFQVPMCSIGDPVDQSALADVLDAQVFQGALGLRAVALESGADIILAATDGMVAFDAIFAAVARGIDIAVANKELIVAAGELLLERAEKSGSRIIPVDSEHSALFQCLQGESPERVASYILTASGGPFRATPLEQIASVSIHDALRHPTWSMGVKNSVDSATMMNKGLEVIETSRLFRIPASRISVIIHPPSIVHGLIAFTDGSVKAQISTPDMRLPIGYALSYPDRLVETQAVRDPLELLGFGVNREHGQYAFERVDPQRFPALGLAYRALEAGGTTPAILSAANEIAVQAFEQGEIGFRAIERVVAETMELVSNRELSLESLAAVDREARSVAKARCRYVADIRK
jgi:1-deoxy-D-xylulose-5-phosphate reductoisomerase